MLFSLRQKRSWWGKRKEVALVCHILSLLSWPTLHLIVIKNIAQVWCLMLITPTCSLSTSPTHCWLSSLRSVPRLLLRVLSCISKALFFIIAITTAIISSHCRSFCSHCNLHLFVHLFVWLFIFHCLMKDGIQPWTDWNCE